MRDVTPSSSPRRRSSLSTVPLARNVVFTEMTGYVDAELADRELQTFRAHLTKTEGPAVWLIDTEHLAGFDPRAVKSGAAWFASFRASGGTRIVHISRGNAARMVAQTLGFGAGVKVTSVNDFDEARREAGISVSSNQSPKTKYR